MVGIILSVTTSKHHYFHFFATENKLKSLEKVCDNKNIFGIVLLTKKNNILEFK